MPELNGQPSGCFDPLVDFLNLLGGPQSFIFLDWFWFAFPESWRESPVKGVRRAFHRTACDPLFDRIQVIEQGSMAEPLVLRTTARVTVASPIAGREPIVLFQPSHAHPAPTLKVGEGRRDGRAVPHGGPRSDGCRFEKDQVETSTRPPGHLLSMCEIYVLSLEEELGCVNRKHRNKKT